MSFSQIKHGKKSHTQIMSILLERYFASPNAVDRLKLVESLTHLRQDLESERLLPDIDERINQALDANATMHDILMRLYLPKQVRQSVNIDAHIQALDRGPDLE